MAKRGEGRFPEVYVLLIINSFSDRKLRNNVRKVSALDADVRHLIEILTGRIKSNGQSGHPEQIEVAPAVSDGDHFFGFHSKLS